MKADDVFVKFCADEDSLSAPSVAMMQGLLLRKMKLKI